MIHNWTRQLGACLLLFCLGLSVPAVAGPMHICLAELLKTEAVEDDCCNHGDSCCDPDEPLDSNCCLDIQDLPEASSLPLPQTAPEATVTDLGWTPSTPPLADLIGLEIAAERPDRIRGPCTPSDHRALLEIWRL